MRLRIFNFYSMKTIVNIYTLHIKFEWKGERQECKHDLFTVDTMYNFIFIFQNERKIKPGKNRKIIENHVNL